MICWIYIQLVSPGTWLADLCPDRYDVRVKKSSKKVLAFNLYAPKISIIRY